jgi:signal peptidase I
MNREATISEAFGTSGVAWQAERKIKVTTQLLHFFLCMVLAAVSYYFISHHIVQTVQVVGSSMYPTMRHADQYLLNRWAYHLHPPKRSDVVVIKDPTDGAFAVKRIIATPGESILFKGGQVYVNGRKLDEPYVSPGTPTWTYSNTAEQLIICGKDQYYVLGDNRDDSFDSRMYGPVRRENILGVVVP